MSLTKISDEGAMTVYLSRWTNPVIATTVSRAGP